MVLPTHLFDNYPPFLGGDRSLGQLLPSNGPGNQLILHLVAGESIIRERGKKPSQLSFTEHTI